MRRQDHIPDLVTEENGTQTIESRLGGRKLSLMRNGDHYRVGLSDGNNTLERSFHHWRAAALSFAILHHTERRIAHLGEW